MQFSDVSVVEENGKFRLRLSAEHGGKENACRSAFSDTNEFTEDDVRHFKVQAEAALRYNLAGE